MHGEDRRRRPSGPSLDGGALAIAATSAPALVLGLAAAAGILSLLVVRSAPVQVLDQVAPFDVASPDPLITAVSGLGLTALAVGLRRGKRLAWWLALVAFASTLVGQLASLGHPIAAGVAALCLLVLAFDRRRYVVATGWSARRGWLLLAALGAIGIALEAAIAVLASEPGPPAGGAPGLASGAFDLARTLISWLSFAGTDPASGVAGRGLLLAVVVSVLRLPIVLAAVGILRSVDESTPEGTARARAADIAARFGHGALLPFQLGSDKLVALDDTIDTTEGLIVYGRAGRYSVVLGDPIGPDQDAWAAFDTFAEATRRRDGIVAVYQATRAGRARLAEAGFRTFRIGHEALVDVASFGLSGSARANLRHTVSRARRGGVSVRWFPAGLDDDGMATLLPGLVAIDAAWRARSGPQLGFTIGAFHPEDASRVAIAVAVEGAHADDSGAVPIAFATFRPTGVDGGMVLDLMRRLPGGTPGALEACIVEALVGLRAKGVPSLSLGLAPLAGLDRAAAPEERVLATAARLVRRWYDIAGLEFFKGKFDPRWEPRYVAVHHRRDLVGLSIALLRLHLGGLRAGLLGVLRGLRVRPSRSPADLRVSAGARGA